MSTSIRRGSIVLADLDPARGSESAKTRPVIVVANNAAVTAAWAHSATVTVVPVTSNTVDVRSFQVLLPADATGLPADSKAQPEQIRTIAVTRIVRPVGWVPAELMGAVDEALRLHLAL